jgi:hypothetical protein
MIHGCYSAKDGTLRVIDMDARQACAKSETALSWNQTGPQGAQGPAGATGPAGPQGPAGVSGYQLITQTQYLDGNTPGITVDLDIPAGKVVVGAGIGTDGFGNAFMSANGPDPADNTKWRFMAPVGLQNGGSGYPMTLHLWMAVVNAS